MLEKHINIRGTETVGNVYRKLCDDSNAVVAQLDSRRAEEYGRGYSGYNDFRCQVPGLGLYLSYIPLPGSWAEHRVSLNQCGGISLLGLQSNYELKHGEVIAKPDTGIVMAYNKETPSIFPDYQMRRLAEHISISEGGFAKEDLLKIDVEVGNLGQDYRQKFFAATRAIAISIRVVELIAEGQSIDEVLYIRKRLVPDGI